MKRAALGMFLLVTVATAPSAQQVWQVNTYGGVQAAVNAAAPGDIIELLGSSFAGFVLNKGLVVRVRNAVLDPLNSAFALEVNVPAGQVAHVAGLRQPLGQAGVDVVGGQVRFEACDIHGSPGIRVRGNAEVVVLRSVIVGRRPPLNVAGIQVQSGLIWLDECDVSGCIGNCGLGAGPAVWLDQGAALHASNSRLTGGYQTFAAGEALATSGVATLKDCQLIGGLGPGAPAISNYGSAPVVLDGATVAGAIVGPVRWTTGLVRLSASSGWQRGSSRLLSVRGAAGAPFAIFVAPDVRSSTLPAVAEPVWAQAGFLLSFGVLDNFGVGSLNVAIPNLAWLEHQVLMLQAFSGTQLPVHASTPVGGVIR